MSQVSRPSILYVFPGQGSQYVGMGSDIHRRFSSVRELYERASSTLGLDVARLSFEDPDDQLNNTEFTQIALLTHSIACLEAFRELTCDEWAPSVVAGHSLGEYSALVAAGALTFEDALRLIRVRGHLMSCYGRGQMAAFRLDLESIKPLAEARYCGIGGCNLPDQTVVCGFENDLEALMEDVAARFGRHKTGRYLKTEGAFHTYLMIGAAERFRPHLDETPLEPPRVRVLSNYTGDYHPDDPEQIRASLFFQMFHPVKWMAGLQRALDDGVSLAIEFGGGIGREQPGRTPSPASRKPNLESIMRKAYRSANRPGLYLPAISSRSLQQSVRLLEVLRQADCAANAARPLDTAWVDERLFSLYLPAALGVASQSALDLGTLVQDLGLGAFVRTLMEAEENSLQTLQACCDPQLASAEPYLEVIVSGQTGAFLHYHGEDIRHELAGLAHRLARPVLRVSAGDLR